MKNLKHLSVLLLLFTISMTSRAQNTLEVISEFPDSRPGNIAVSNDGRIFVTMSALSSSKYMVKEILKDGKAVPFGEEKWIMKPEGKSIIGINSTIGIQADNKGMLWVLDMGNGKNNQAPKLVGFDLTDGKMKKVYPIPSTVLTDKPFLQDFVIDEKHNLAIIADMTDALNPPIAPAFVVINLGTGNIRRVLENHPSMLPIDEPVKVNGRMVSHKKEDGSEIQPRYPLNPIAISENRDLIYYGAMGAKKIYTIQTKLLADENTTSKDLENAVTFYANKTKSDGFKVDADGKVYVTDVENSAISVSTTSGMKTIAQDNKRLSWPDGVAIHEGYLYIVANQLHNLALLNNGKDVSKPPYLVLKINIQE